MLTRKVFFFLCLKMLYTDFIASNIDTGLSPLEIRVLLLLLNRKITKLLQ